MAGQRDRVGKDGVTRRSRPRAPSRADSAGDRAKQAFLSVVSHELRTPLNTIIGQADLLADDGLPAHAREAVEAIRSAGQALYASLNDILELARLEGGTAPVEDAELDIRSLVEGVRRLCQPKAWAQELDLDLTIDPAVPARLRGDGVRIRQTLINLTGNALKFTEKGGVSVTVEMVSPTMLRFAVADTGVGIPKREQKRLFIPFEQRERVLTRQHEGLGLGLALCKRLVQSMGGTIGLTSEVGIGSTFWFTVPVSAADLNYDTGLAEADSGEADPTALARIRGIRVLAADDNPMHRANLQRIFEAAQISVDLVSDGLEAVEAAGRKAYDAILLDAHMPVIGGIQAAHMIRTVKQNQQTSPLIVLACPAGDFSENDAVGLCDVIVRKPYTARALVDALHTVVVGEDGQSDFDSSGVVELEQTVGRPILVDILKSFLATAVELAHRIDEAVPGADVAAMETAARDLSGAASGLGLAALTLAARELSQAARRDERKDISLKAREVVELTGRTQRELTILYPDLGAQAA